MKSDLTFGLALLVLCTFIVGAQPEEAWNRTYGGPGFEGHLACET